jgi:hypothetical protein
MLIEICFGAEKTAVDLLDGVVHVGGAASDAIHFAGMPGSLLTLNLVGERLMVTAARSVSIGGTQFPAHVPRLVVPGEKMLLPNNVTLQQLPQKNVRHRSFKATACVLKELVGDGFSPASSRAATLTCLTGLDAGCTFPIAMRETGIGRGETCAIRVRDRTVSRRHARVVRQRTTDFLEAMPDTNGLFINGEPVTEATQLRSGDVVELGHSLLRYDGPELALVDDEKVEATVLVAVDELEEIEIEEMKPEVLTEAPMPGEFPVVAAPTATFPLEMVLIATGTVLALLGLAVTISACA